MKVLVIDDNTIHLQAAKETLGEHELTVVDNYDEAVKYLDREVAHDEIFNELDMRGVKDPGWDNKAARKKYENQWKVVKNELLEKKYFKFDVVLCDLLMPAGEEMQGPNPGQLYGHNDFVGQMMPVGFALALRAVLHGARYVAVVTATNHHNHPASAMLDRLGKDYWERAANPIGANLPKFVINGVRVGFYHHPSYKVKDAAGKEHESKHWGMVLQALMQVPS